MDDKAIEIYTDEMLNLCIYYTEKNDCLIIHNSEYSELLKAINNIEKYSLGSSIKLKSDHCWGSFKDFKIKLMSFKGSVVVKLHEINGKQDKVISLKLDGMRKFKKALLKAKSISSCQKKCSPLPAVTRSTVDK